MKTSALSVFAAVAVMGLAQADTIAWYHFSDGEPDTAATASTVIRNAVNGNKHSGYVHSFVKDDWSGTSGDYMPLFENPYTDGFAIYDPVSGETFANSMAIRFHPKNGMSNGECDSGVVLIPDDEEFHNRMFTVECFIRSDGPDNAGTWQPFLTYPNNNLGYRFSWALIAQQNAGLGMSMWSNDGSAPLQTVNEGEYATQLRDGKWHHLALTCDGTKAKLFLDYACVKSATITEGHAPYYVGNKPIAIGAELDCNYGRWTGWVDEVRISDSTLTPDQFLRAATPESDVVAWYRFEEGTIGTRTTKTTYLVDSANGGTFHARCHGVDASGVINDGNADYFPTFADGMLGSAFVYDPISGTCVANKGSLNFRTANSVKKSGSYDSGLGGIVNSANPLLYGLKSMSAEFFFKSDCEKNQTAGYQTLLALPCRGGTIYTWGFMAHKDGSMPFEIATASSQANNNLCNSTYNCHDGKWHHAAMTCDGSVEGKITLKLYIDYQLSVTKTLSQELFHTGDFPLYVGAATGNNWRKWVGNIDEVRIVKRVLDPSEFLRLRFTDAEPETVTEDTAVYISFDRLGAALPAAESDLRFATRLDMNEVIGGTDVPAACFVKHPSGFMPELDTVTKARAILYPARGMDLPGLTDLASFHFKTNAERSSSSFAVRDVVGDAHTIVSPDGSCTIEMFVKADTPPQGDFTYLFCQQNAKAGGDFRLGVATSGKLIYIVGGNTSPYLSCNLCDGKWHHLAFVLDRKAKQAILYFDRQAVHVMDNVAYDSQVYADNPYLQIAGGYGTENSRGFQLNGWMDDVRISRRALKPGEFLTDRKQTGMLMYMK